MNTWTLAQLLDRHPLVFFHLVTAFASLVTGGMVLLRRKGTPSHRGLGWAFVVLMACTTVASAFIRDYRGLNLAGITPIHAFTVLVAVTLPRGVWYARQGNLVAHRSSMRNLYFGACVVAGVFTLLPGRFLGGLLWRQWLGVLS
jgi:uncharacterized membrane protein